jgi:hypothetical protein
VEAAITMGACPFVGGVETAAEQIEEHAGDVLRYRLDRLHRRVECALQRDVEVLVPSSVTHSQPQLGLSPRWVRPLSLGSTVNASRRLIRGGESN